MPKKTKVKHSPVPKKKSVLTSETAAQLIDIRSLEHEFRFGRTWEEEQARRKVLRGRRKEKRKLERKTKRAREREEALSLLTKAAPSAQEKIVRRGERYLRGEYGRTLYEKLTVDMTVAQRREIAAVAAARWKKREEAQARKEARRVEEAKRRGYKGVDIARAIWGVEKRKLHEGKSVKWEFSFGGRRKGYVLLTRVENGVAVKSRVMKRKAALLLARGERERYETRRTAEAFGVTVKEAHKRRVELREAVRREIRKVKKSKAYKNLTPQAKRALDVRLNCSDAMRALAHLLGFYDRRFIFGEEEEEEGEYEEELGEH